jgi:hypothetical protein
LVDSFWFVGRIRFALVGTDQLQWEQRGKGKRREVLEACAPSRMDKKLSTTLARWDWWGKVPQTKGEPKDIAVEP